MTSIGIEMFGLEKIHLKANIRLDWEKTSKNKYMFGLGKKHLKANICLDWKKNTSKSNVWIGKKYI